jgi:hypothetical protein
MRTSGLPEPERLLLRCHARVAWGVAICFIVLFAALDRLVSLAIPVDRQFVARLLLVAVAALLTTAVATRVLLGPSARLMRERQAARRREAAATVRGVRLAANTLQHYLGNRLTITAGFGQLLARDPRLPEPLRDTADRAARGALGAADALGTLQRAAETRRMLPLMGEGSPFPTLDLGEDEDRGG